MVKHDVALPNGGEEVRRIFQARSDGCYESWIAQLGGVIPLIDGHDSARVERPIDNITVVFSQMKRFEELCPDFLRAIALDLQAHGFSLSSVMKLVLNGFQEVGYF